jgi:nucleoside-diphosphate-sugar epimerase
MFMKILVAGATGAIGRPTIDLLIQEGHDVYGVTQSKEKALSLSGQGVKPVVLDILKREEVFTALEGIKPDVVIDMLTHLPKEYTPNSMRAAAELDGKIRIEGGANLQAAAIKSGAKRYIAQSSGFWYAPGPGLADESAPFAFEAPFGIASGCKLYAEIEQRVLETDQIEGVVLRFGFFYGPGTWFHSDGNVAEQIRKRQFPVIGNGEGVWNFVHIHDAAKATVMAVYSYPGIYNIVNDTPSPMKQWLPAFARFLDAKPPETMSEEEGMRQKGADWVYYATKLRAASNAKAKRLLDFQPRSFEWLL